MYDMCRREAEEGWKPKVYAQERQEGRQETCFVCAFLCFFAAWTWNRRTSTGAASCSDEKEIMDSFEEEYREVLIVLPPELFPVSTKHGKHSFTRQCLA